MRYDVEVGLLCVAKAIAYKESFAIAFAAIRSEASQGGSIMSYKKAAEVLPAELLDKIQYYIDGEFLYIPRKTDNRKAWGESTCSKSETLLRNEAICRDYQNGLTVPLLAGKYFLSVKSIQRIIKGSRM